MRASLPKQILAGARLLSPSSAGRQFAGLLHYLGGSDSDQGNSIALDSSNEAYVAEHVFQRFPMANAYQTYCAPGPYNGNSNDITERNGCGSYNSAFITKLNSTGTALLYSTFFGGKAIRPGTPSPWTLLAAPISPQCDGGGAIINPAPVY